MSASDFEDTTGAPGPGQIGAPEASSRQQESADEIETIQASLLRLLWPSDEDGWLSMCVANKSAGIGFRTDGFFPITNIDELLSAADDRAGQGFDVWFSVGALGGKPISGRGPQAMVRWVPALWADIDGDKVADLDVVPDVLGRLPLPPQALVHSGNGYHAYWLLDEPFEVTSGESRAEIHVLNLRLRQWLCDLLEADLDNAQDLARVLRLPGTFNHKGDQPLPVRLVWVPGEGSRRYSVDELDRLLPRYEDRRPNFGDPADFAKQGTATGDESEAVVEKFLPRAIEKARNREGRDNAGFWLAQQLNDHYVPQATAYEALEAYALEVPDFDTGTGEYEPFTAEHGRAKVDSAYSYPPRGPAGAPDMSEYEWDPVGEPSEDQLRAYSVGELLAYPDGMQWLVETFWPHPSYGTLGGPEKSMKSYLSTLLVLAVASARPFLGVYPVHRQGPVTVFTGEAGRKLWIRRARHLARGMGISDEELASLPIRVIDEAAPILRAKFGRTLERELALAPVLVVVDPFYTYQGGQKAAGNVYENAEVYNALSGKTQEAGSSLVVVNHFTKSGAKELSLSSVTQAGAREWSDSWVLLGHREKPNLSEQEFKLKAVVGSRQWGGEALDIDIRLGPFDKRLCRTPEAPTWSVTPSDDAEASAGTTVKEAVLDMIRDNPGQLTKSDVKKGGERQAKRARVFEEMTKAGQIYSEMRQREGDPRPVPVWFATPVPGEAG